ANRDQPLAIPSSASSDTTTENASQIADEDAGNERNADNPKNLIDSANADQVFALGHIAHSLYTDADFVGPRQFKIRRSSTTAERATAAAGKSDDHDAGAIGLSTSSRMV
ncbi:MAG: hypothetical protein KDA99_04875, partial [Planctomycetales bacterium]|nr:hypothetical protein [Planctomycetales bacterium]